MLSKGATQDEVRRHNLSALLRQIHVRGALSRAELTEWLGLNRSTVGDLVGELVTLGVLREDLPPHRLGAGRPSPIVRPASDQVHVLAADIGVESITVATVGLGGVVIDRTQVDRHRDDAGPAAVAGTIARAARDLRSRHPGTGRLISVGVAVAGVVRRRDGLVHFGPNLGWYEVPFGRMLADALVRDIPVFVGNDADVGVLGEQTRGAAAGRSDVIYLSGDIGVGGGIILGGRPLDGASGYGGEVGHMIVNRDSPTLCRCGARGCWETEIGVDALLVRAGHAAGEGRPGVLAVLEEARLGKPDAVAALEVTGGWLGDGLASLINVFNPEIVIMGGMLGDIYSASAATVAEHVARLALSAPRAKVRLELPGLGADSIILGAAELAFGPLLNDPAPTMLAIGAD
ncbi:MAG: ROK family protein [Mycobacteriales bacterium]